MGLIGLTIRSGPLFVVPQAPPNCGAVPPKGRRRTKAPAVHPPRGPLLVSSLSCHRAVAASRPTGSRMSSKRAATSTHNSRCDDAGTQAGSTPQFPRRAQPEGETSTPGLP